VVTTGNSLQKFLFLKKAAVPAFLFVLLLIQVLFIINAPWVGDYWEHRAVLNELILHPANPSHPILLADKPHAFFSPYLVAFGWLGHYAHLSASQLLSLAAIGNLLLFVLSIRLLAGIFLPAGNRQLQVAALMAAVLFCWGYDPPNFSSFYHAGTFFFTTPYPSTFSFTLSVLAAACFHYLMHHAVSVLWRLLLASGIVLLLTTVLLTHPLTFLFGAALFAAIGLQAARCKTTSLFRITVSGLGFLILPFALASFWPYYPFYELLGYVEPGNRFHADSRELYSSLYFKLFPLVMLVIFLVRKPGRFIMNHLPVLFSMALLAGLFFYGFFSGSYGFGRMIAFIALLAQLLLVKIAFEEGVRQIKLFFALLMLCCLPFVAVSLKQLAGAAFTTHKQYLKRPVHQPFELTQPAEMAHRLQFLEKKIPAGALVLTDTICARYVPGFGARIVATPFPLYWITDQEQRLRDARIFFYSGTPASRDSLLQQYQPAFLLLTPTTRYLLPQLTQWTRGQRVYEENGLLLVPLNTSPQTNN
jgi:hypothetical protein